MSAGNCNAESSISVVLLGVLMWASEIKVTGAGAFSTVAWIGTAHGTEKVIMHFSAAFSSALRISNND